MIAPGKKNRGARGFLPFHPVSNSAKPRNVKQAPPLSWFILLKTCSAKYPQKGLLLINPRPSDDNGLIIH